MTKIRALMAFLMPAAPRFHDIAVGDLTDNQLRRSGLNKAELLHVRFSGFHTCG